MKKYVATARLEPAPSNITEKLGPWTTRLVDSSPRSGQLGSWTACPEADNSVRTYRTPRSVYTIILSFCPES